MNTSVSNPALVALQQGGMPAQWGSLPTAPVTVSVTTTATVVNIPLGTTVTASGAISVGITPAVGTPVAAGPFTWPGPMLVAGTELYVAAVTGTVTLSYVLSR